MKNLQKSNMVYQQRQHDWQSLSPLYSLVYTIYYHYDVDDRALVPAKFRAPALSFLLSISILPTPG